MRRRLPKAYTRAPSLSFPLSSHSFFFFAFFLPSSHPNRTHTGCNYKEGSMYLQQCVDKSPNDQLCGGRLYLTRCDVNTRLDSCHGFFLPWQRRALLIGGAQRQMWREGGEGTAARASRGGHETGTLINQHLDTDTDTRAIPVREEKRKHYQGFVVYNTGQLNIAHSR